MFQCDAEAYQLEDKTGCSNKPYKKALSLIEDTRVSETKICGKVKIEIKSRTDLLVYHVNWIIHYEFLPPNKPFPFTNFGMFKAMH
jgi:hypothetical protein